MPILAQMSLRECTENETRRSATHCETSSWDLDCGSISPASPADERLRPRLRVAKADASVSRGSPHMMPWSCRAGMRSETKYAAEQRLRMTFYVEQLEDGMGWLRSSHESRHGWESLAVCEWICRSLDRHGQLSRCLRREHDRRMIRTTRMDQFQFAVCAVYNRRQARSRRVPIAEH